jgi:hypothetical protein
MRISLTQSLSLLGKRPAAVTVGVRIGVFALIHAMSGAAWGLTYACVDENGKHHSADRPNPECLTRDQQVINSDGSFNHTWHPAPSASDVVALEACKATAADQLATKQQAVRLVGRFPSEASHLKERQARLDSIQQEMVRSERRLADLLVERKPLSDEAEFFVGKSLPADLKRKIDGNDASIAAQKDILQNERLELADTNARYDGQLTQLKTIWSGPPPQSWSVKSCSDLTISRE